MTEKLIKLIQSLIYMSKSSKLKIKARELLQELNENYVIISKEEYDSMTYDLRYLQEQANEIQN